MKLPTDKELNGMPLEKLEKVEDEIYKVWSKMRAIVEYRKAFDKK